MPHRQSLEPRLLAAAPELAALALLDAALTVCATALLAAHPTLGHELRLDPAAPSLRAAGRLLASIDRLQHAVTRYRDAVLDALAPPDADRQDDTF